MTTPTASAPLAPGRIGEPVDPTAMQHYLSDLDRWREQRHHELAALDQAVAALPATERDAATRDLVLAMALWQAVATRYDELVHVWDGGRAGQVERLRSSSLLWGRLQPPTGVGAAAGADSLAVSLPEACRLSDALCGQLRVRCALDPVGLDLAAHLRTLRAALERVRDLVPDEPYGAARDAASARWHDLDRRLDDVEQRARRGADVGGLVGPLEADTAVVERDLIVAAATRRDDARDLARAAELQSTLAARSDLVGRLADRCTGRVAPAPRLAVPQVAALGPVPTDPVAVDAYLDRLASVGRALEVAERTYRAAMTEHDDLTALLDGYAAKARAVGRADDVEVAQLLRATRDLLAGTPTPMVRARLAVAAFQTLLGAPPPGPAPSGRNR